MKLSKTTKAVDWLEQFDADDRAAAVALLDAVRFVPGGTVIAGVRRSIERLITDNPSRSPLAVVPVISREDMRPIVDVDEDAPLTVFDEFDPAQLVDNEPGSEALIAQLVREIRRGAAGGSFVDSPLTLRAMEDAEVRTLLCVTDYIGSGRQVLEYLATWYRHPTIKSWRSFGWLRIEVVAYAATTAGKRVVEASPLVDLLDVIEIAPALARLSNIPAGEKMIEVCRLYAKRGGLGTPLGYRNSAGLFASSSSVPNNLPAILIRRSNRWNPFFEGRTVPAILSDEIGDQHPDVNVPQELEDAGQVRLAARHRDGHLDRPWQEHIAMLGLLPRADDELAISLGLDVPAVTRIRASLEHFALIDASGALTESGRRALSSHRRQPRRIATTLVPDPSPYYPRYKT